MTAFHAVVLLTTLLCSLVTGFLLAFAVVVMPGLKRLDDGGFIRSFQAIDRVIQNNQPVFMFMWVGSVLAVVAAAVMAVWSATGFERTLLIVATVVYLLGVQLPTIAINVPLNNALQRLNADALDDAARRQARDAFEPRWNRWNAFRTVLACVASILMLITVAFIT